MNFETVLRRRLDRLEEFQRASSDLRCRPMCHLFVLLSLWCHGRDADKTGNISKSPDLRDLYQLLGTYAPTDFNVDTEMQVTYASPGAAPYY